MYTVIGPTTLRSSTKDTVGKKIEKTWPMQVSNHRLAYNGP